MKPISVLLIDDDYDYYTMTSQMLAHVDVAYQVDWVGTYAEGLKALERNQHDIYLVDYLLGHYSGFDLLKQVRKRGTIPPVIMLTGDSPDFEKNALESGAADLLSKIGLKPKMLQRSIRYAIKQGEVQRQLLSSNSHYYNLINSIEDGVILADADDRIILSNDIIKLILGYQPQELLGQAVGSIIHDLPPRPLIPKTSSDIYQAQHKNSRLLKLEVSVHYLDDGQTQYVLQMANEQLLSRKERDLYLNRMTILHQVDAELSHIVNIDSVLALALDAAVRLSGADSGFIGILDNNQLTVVETLGYYNVFKGNQDVMTIPIIQRMLDDGQAHFITDITQEPDIEELDPSSQAFMLLPMMSYERMVGILTLGTHISDRFSDATYEFLQLITARVAVATENAQLYKIAQDQLAQMQSLYNQVSELEKIKTDMIRIAAHDLRNPVSIVLNYVTLLRHAIKNNTINDNQHYVDMIDQAGQRMRKITTDILSLERIENLQMEPGQLVNLVAIVRNTHRDFHQQAVQKLQKLNMTIEPGIPNVRGDAAQINEAVVNLLSNAIKYTPEEGTILLHIRQDKGEVIFTVKDSGFGIPEIHQDQLFQPFYRTEQEETKSIEGTGLGLYIIKNIIERYDGRIIFESVYGEGSTFGFALPTAN